MDVDLTYRYVYCHIHFHNMFWQNMVGALCVMVGSYYYISTGVTTAALFLMNECETQPFRLKIIIIPGGNILTAKKIRSKCMLLIRLKPMGDSCLLFHYCPFPYPLSVSLPPSPFFSLIIVISQHLSNNLFQLRQ